MKTCFQTTTVSSAMFITAMAANPLAVNLAAAEGINISWGLWAMAGLVPGLICLTTVPLILYALLRLRYGVHSKQTLHVITCSQHNTPLLFLKRCFALRLSWPVTPPRRQRSWRSRVTHIAA